MKKESVAVVYSSGIPNWQSCRSILSNLRAAYRHLEADYDVLWFPVCEEATNFDLQFGGGFCFERAKELLSAGVGKIFFLDRHPAIRPLILALKILNRKRAAEIEYFLHVYGDFTLFTDYWFELGQELTGLQTRLFCASDRQVELVRSFEQNQSNFSSEYCPFAVDTKYFSFSETIRSTWRKNFNLKSQDHLVAYTGRISLQKGVLNLIDEFQIQAKSNPNLVLALAGSCDDIGGLTAGIKLSDGYFFQRFQEALQNLPKSVRERIKWLGRIPGEEVRGLYCAADSFISLSLYHDEDFGMSPAEALSTGLPALMSDWGGYSSFSSGDNQVNYVPVTLADRGLSFDAERLHSGFTKLVHEKLTSKERFLRARKFESRFSIDSVGSSLRKNVLKSPNPFSGFSWRLNASKNKIALKSGLYRDLYRHYVTPEALQ